MTWGFESMCVPKLSFCSDFVQAPFCCFQNLASMKIQSESMRITCSYRSIFDARGHTTLLGGRRSSSQELLAPELQRCFFLY
jgi:hypothetical protein